MEVDLLGYLYHDTVYHKIRTVDELAGGLRTVVGGTVFGPHPVVDGCLGLFDMQLARIAVGILAAEVIDAIGDVAGLLNLSKEVACTNSVQTTCGQEEKVALVSLVNSKHVLKPPPVPLQREGVFSSALFFPPFGGVGGG